MRFFFTAILTVLAMLVAILSLPASLYAFGSNPPLPNTSAPGQGTCASCHGTLTAGSGVTVNVPSSYTPGGAAVSMTVTIPATGGFELEVGTQISNVQAGTLTAGSNDAVSTVGGIQFAYSTAETTSWTFSWKPPTTNVGNVVLYVTGGGHSPNYSNNFVMMPAAAAPPPPPPPPPPAASLSATPTTLTFNYQSGTSTPGSQPVLVSSSGAALSYKVATSGGTWLSAGSASGNTPGSVNVSVNPTGLQPNTYSGTVTITSSGATGSPQTVNVKMVFNSAPPPTTPTPPPAPPQPPTTTLSLSATPQSLSFNYQIGGRLPAPRTLTITSTGGSTSYTATESDPWLKINPTSGSSTPGKIQASVNPTGLSAGTYGAQINVSAPNGKTATISVSLNITSGSSQGGRGGSAPGGMYAQPYMYDPTQSGTLAATWVDNLGTSPHNSSDPRNQGFLIAKSASAPANTTAGLTIQNVTGVSLTSLGFDLRAGVQCGPDSPQFVVVTTNGVTHSVGGCSSSLATPQSSAPMGWTHLQFDPASATPPISQTDQVQSISVVLGKGANQSPLTSTPTTGSIAVIDNITVNGMPVGKRSTSSSTDD
jgi:hypothetical protein